MSEGAGDARRLGWGGALALGLVTLMLAAVDPVPLVLLPFALLLAALRPIGARWVAIGAAVWLLGAVTAVGPVGTMALAWASVLGTAFVGATMVVPAWSAFARMAVSVATATGALFAGLQATGRWAMVDDRMRAHFEASSAALLEYFQARAPDAAWVAQLGNAAPRVAELQWMLFPAVLSLQSLAALALAWWWFVRLRGAEGGWSPQHRIRDFRFDDQLVWLMIGGLALVVLPLAGWADRLGWNLLAVMASLSVLRGIAVLLFWAAGLPRVVVVLAGVFTLAFGLVPFFLTLAFVVGVGDTWLDVRGRAAVAAQT
jgi:hypothetical protein